MYKHVFKFIVATLTILTVNLITSYISNLLVMYKFHVKPLRFTLISMGVITIIFYPLFLKLEDWLNIFSKKFVKAGHSLAGKYMGLILMFLVGIFILMYFYARMWYNVNIFKMIYYGTFFQAF